jgi:hypothetical protein
MNLDSMDITTVVGARGGHEAIRARTLTTSIRSPGMGTVGDDLAAASNTPACHLFLPHGA